MTLTPSSPSPEVGYLSESSNRHLATSRYHRNPPSKPTGRPDVEGFTAAMSRTSPSDHHRNRPPFFRGGSSTDSSSSESSSGAVTHSAWAVPPYAVNEDRENSYFRPGSEPDSSETRYKLPAISSQPPPPRQRYPNVLNPDSDERVSNPQLRAAEAAPSKVEFYTWKNLPSRRMLEKCFTAYFGPIGLSSTLCPFPPSEAWAMLRAVFEAAAASGSRGGGTAAGGESGAAVSHVGFPGGDPTLQTTSANSQLCQMLLIAAVGSQNLSSQEMVSKEISEALFTSAKWYLDVMFGREADEFQKLRANILCGICLIFNKNVKGKEHISKLNIHLWMSSPWWGDSA